MSTMRPFLRILPLLALCAVLDGCRYKGWESFYSATTTSSKRNLEDPRSTPNIVGDPASFGSLAAATGGLKFRTNYGTGANSDSKAPVNPAFDRPEMGSGQQMGEYPVTAAPGYGADNGPALQPDPSSVGEVGAPLAHG